MLLFPGTLYADSSQTEAILRISKNNRVDFWENCVG
jgi:hypothetical protein